MMDHVDLVTTRITRTPFAQITSPMESGVGCPDFLSGYFNTLKPGTVEGIDWRISKRV